MSVDSESPSSNDRFQTWNLELYVQSSFSLAFPLSLSLILFSPFSQMPLFIKAFLYMFFLKTASDFTEITNSYMYLIWVLFLIWYNSYLFQDAFFFKKSQPSSYNQVMSYKIFLGLSVWLNCLCFLFKARL